MKTKYEFDYSKLKGRIREMFITQDDFAKAMGRSSRSLSLKLNNKTYFSQGEIARSLCLLNISNKDIPLYFFTLKV